MVMRMFGSQPTFSGPRDFVPAYLSLGLEELRRRAARAVEGLAECKICPRECRVDRLQDHWSACKTGRMAVVTSAFPHLGEEDCLRGRNGSGTIFLGHCNLRCVFCQNHEISQGLSPGPPREGTLRELAPGGRRTVRRPRKGTPGTDAGTMASMMLRLQEMGCHNINLVTPEHVVPQILEALVLAAEEGLRLPIVYNTSGYDSLESLGLLDGIVDIFMPDLKLFDPALCRRLLKAGDYPDVARAALVEMHRQVGPLRIGADGLARRGVLVRHLVLPGLLAETRAVLSWIRDTLGTATFVNLMGQYHPGGIVSGGCFPELNRPLSREEILSARKMARELGLTRLAQS